MKAYSLNLLEEGLRNISEKRKHRVKKRNNKHKKRHSLWGQYRNNRYGTYFYPGVPMGGPHMMAPILPGGHGPFGGPGGGPMGPGGFDGGPGDCGGFGESEDDNISKKRILDETLIKMTKQIRKSISN